MNGLTLALDTASNQLAVAVGRIQAGQLELIGSREQPALRSANTQLLPAIDSLLRQQGIAKTELDAVVCGLGPGSFTGVRIALATAKGLARGLGRPLYGVGTLTALAWQAWAGGLRGRLGVVADAMRQEVYSARFELTAAGVEQQETLKVGPAAAISATWQALGQPLQLIGDGLFKYAAEFGGSEVASELFQLAEPAFWLPTGRGLLLAEAADGGWPANGNAGAVLPIYTRLSDAEENERIRLAAGGPLAQGAAVLLPASGFVQAFPLAVQPGVIPTTESALSSPAGPASIAESAQPAPAAAEFIFYRPMAAQDLSQVVQLERQCFVASPLSGECWTEANFQTELNTPQHSWWVAWQGQELAGYCGGWLQDGDLQVLDIAVDPSWRRRGIGRQLLQRLLSDARELGATTASLEVRPSNSAARAFYDDLGFQTAGRRPGYYTALTAGTAREDALLLVKDLQLGQPVAGAAAGGSGPINAAFPSGRPTADAEFAPAAADLPSAAIPAPCILALETSCDETAAAIINGRGELLANVVASQVDFHARFGGVVPEIASRKHIEAISGVVDAVIEQSGLTSWQQLQAVAVTYAPGLIGALVVGVAFAKGLAWAIDRPLVAVNHLEGHIYANRLAPRSDSDSTLVLQPQPQPPFIIALLSGGHTMLVAVRDWGKYQVLGQTLDDAVGEAFDKVAKALGLGYPGGPVISRLAAAGNPRAIDFPRALLHSQDLSFSLSGLKTAVISWIRQAEAAGQTINMADVAASFQQAVIDVQVAKARLACVEQGMTTFCLGGGVAANRDLREAYRQELGAAGIQVFFPPLSVCSDNAAMIAACALDRYARARFLSLAGDAQAFADLSQDY